MENGTVETLLFLNFFKISSRTLVYYRGTIKAVHSGDRYDILDYSGLTQSTMREDIITEDDDADSVLQASFTAA